MHSARLKTGGAFGITIGYGTHTLLNYGRGCVTVLFSPEMSAIQRMTSIRVAAPLVTLLLSGCVVGPNYRAPEVSLPSKFAEGGQTSNSDVSMKAWWTAFSDTRLNDYMQT
ncbi:MAG: hypothetical protein EON58_15915, partial [Alphaproteobacteria bacterium]